MKRTNTSTYRYKVFLEFDGTRYSGWQKQDDARTVQGELLAAAALIFAKSHVDIQGCGRTDAGVHALEYTAHLEAAMEIEPERLRMAMNDRLPPDINVLGIEHAHPRFHARHHCLGRSYIYRISKKRTAFGKKYVWWVKDKLDVAAMKTAAAVFAGMHDFASFAEKQELKKSTKVFVNDMRVHDDGEMITIRVVGSHFLWKMVRRMAGILVEVGRNNLTEKDIRRFLEELSDIPAHHTAPPSGLFFERAFFEEKTWLAFLDGLAKSQH